MSSGHRKSVHITARKLILPAILILLAILIIRGCVKDDGLPDRIVAGYLPVWDYSCYTDLDYTVLTHINIAFINPDENGDLKCGIPSDELDRIVRKAHRKGVKVEAALGGGSGSSVYASVITGGEAIEEFDMKIMDFLREHNLDGVDVDVEGGAEEAFWDYYDAWIKDLSKRCSGEDMILSGAVATWYDGHISAETLKRFDYLSVMAYDNTADSENPSTCAYAESCLKHFSVERGVPEDKLILGIPFYGYRYVNGVCTGEVVPYSEIAAYNKPSKHADISGTCRYNGADTVKKKTRLAGDYRGVMIWALDQDAPGDMSLLKAIGEELSGR